MYPCIVQQPAAEHLKGLLAAADNRRRARQARSARRSRASWHSTGLSLPGAPAVPERRPATLSSVR